MKTKTLTLSHGHYNPKATMGDMNALLYRVERVTDSVDYKPGDMLTKEAVKELCDKAAWKVTIQPIK